VRRTRSSRSAARRGTAAPPEWLDRVEQAVDALGLVALSEVADIILKCVRRDVAERATDVRTQLAACASGASRIKFGAASGRLSYCAMFTARAQRAGLRDAPFGATTLVMRRRGNPDAHRNQERGVSQARR